MTRHEAGLSVQELLSLFDRSAGQPLIREAIRRTLQPAAQAHTEALDGDAIKNAYQNGKIDGAAQAHTEALDVAAERVSTMPTARIISQWDLVSRKAVLAILKADR